MSVVDQMLHDKLLDIKSEEKTVKITYRNGFVLRGKITSVEKPINGEIEINGYVIEKQVISEIAGEQILFKRLQ